MRKLISLATLIAIVSALAIGVSVSSAAARATKEMCSSTNYNPTPHHLSGVYFVFDRCPAPFGNTVESGTYTSTVNMTTGAGTIKGAFTRWFFNGTDHGHYSGNFQFTSATDATYTIAITVTGGTGSFKGVKGKGTERCTTTNAGASMNCKYVVELTGLR